VLAVNDAGAPPWTSGFAASLQGGQLLAFVDVRVDGAPTFLGYITASTQFEVHNVSGRLHLATFNGPPLGAPDGYCPNCAIDGFFAEYLCTP
jgi:hypothetical protein